jgi:hypothetical protein
MPSLIALIALMILITLITLIILITLITLTTLMMSGGVARHHRFCLQGGHHAPALLRVHLAEDGGTVSTISVIS